MGKKNSKVKIEGVKKSALRSEFIFEKSWAIVDSINDVLDKLGFLDVPGHNLKDLIYGVEPGPKEKINNFIDGVYGMENDDYFVNVFLGKEKIILVVNSCVDRQREISDVVFEFVDFGDAEPKSLSKLGNMKLDGN